MTKTRLIVVLAFVMLALALPVNAEINESVNVNLTIVQQPVNITANVTGGTDGLVFGYVLFMLVLAGVFFIAPTLFGSFSTTQWVNLAFVRGSYVTGFFMLFFANASIGDMMTTLLPALSNNAWQTFEIVGVVLEIIILCFMAITLYDVVMSVSAACQRKRMGDDQ